ncbi:hypothetical protein ACJQWK_10584 [Exserohilum turcicum]|uniref:AB hydrolase-1 domain-containing protein n=1 Tax=Exserohilum turcicum (strain 28A) TaxID=671987 RepID=R0JYL5_EXST2|nr:uncharacterized protein SETTUDRAFT_142751 [Exserohilum turcica Et28A]EOA81337.1 hypothetical protein SETTUDRAFT_142751 [Exserohilum turcica Et28A]
MVDWKGLFVKAYWTFAGLGMIWAVFIGSLISPTLQRHALYAHRFNTNFMDNISNPEEFGFAKGQVQPFRLTTADDENLFCWHVIPLDVYLENEHELSTAAAVGQTVDGLKGTVGEKLLSMDLESKVVVNFHGNAGHIAQGYRPSTYRSISGIPKTHLLTCDYRGFGISSLKNAPHIPTETGIITDAISLVSYVCHNLSHPVSRTVLLGQSLGTAVTAAAALYHTDPNSPELPHDLVRPRAPGSSTKAPKPPTETFAAIVLVAPFRTLPLLLQHYRISGLIPVLKPLQGYPRIANYLASRIVDQWPTQARLEALISSDAARKLGFRISLLHARNDQDISYFESESLFAPLQTLMLASGNAAADAAGSDVSAEETRRSVHGGERVKRGAFAYKKVEDSKGERLIELEVTRYGGHNEVVGWSQVALAVRRGFEKRRLRPGLDVE